MDTDRLDQLLDDALRLPPAERRPFLDRSCADDPALRAEVLSLLEIHSRFPSELGLARAEPDAARDHAIEQTPQQIGRYRVKRVLGRGGLGVVYLARDERLERWLALKVLSSALLERPGWRERFVSEARALAALQHPNIASVHSLEEDGPTLFLTMELVRGQTLHSHLRRTPLDLIGALRLSRQIAAALEAAHRRGILHCDLQPSNVMVIRGTRIKVLDFGLARWMRASTDETDPKAEAATAATQATSEVAFTPGYASPEQLGRGLLGPGADLWSFGCLAYECLTGVAAFPGESALERIAATYAGVVDWSLLPAALPDGVREALRACLSSASEDRPAAARDVRRAFDQALLELEDPASGGVAAGAAADAFVMRPEFDALGPALAAHRVVTLVGLGGCGKSRLAREFASAAGNLFEGGVIWVEAPSVGGAESLARTCLRRLGLQEAPDRPAADLVVEHLRARQILLVLDGCEAALEGAVRLVRALSAPDGRAHLLVTSREPLGLEQEHLLEVRPLPTPQSESKLELASNPAARLFVQRLRSRQPEFELTDENAAAVRTVCRALEGIPLALEIAAARVALSGLAAVASRADDRMGWRSIRRGAPQRQRGLRALLAWSYRLLSESERALLRRLSVFVDGCDLSTAESVTAGLDLEPSEIRDLLEALARKSLLEWRRTDATEASARCRMLDTVAQFARRRLAQSGELEATEQALIECLGERIRVAAELWREASDASGFDLLEREHTNVLRVLELCLERADRFETGMELVQHLERFWQVRAHWSTLVQFTEAYIARATEETLALGHVYVAAAAPKLYRGDLGGAESYYAKAHAIGERFGAKALVGRAVANLGGVALHAGDLSRARGWFEQALVIDRALGQRDGEMVALSNLGLCAERAVDLDEAARLYEGAIAIARELSNHNHLPTFLANLAAVSIHRNDLDRAEELLLEADGWFERLGDRWGQAHARFNRSAVWLARGAHVEARAETERALRFFLERDHVYGIARAVAGLAEMARARGEFVEGALLSGTLLGLEGPVEQLLTPGDLATLQRVLEEGKAALGAERFGELEAEGRTRGRGWMVGL